jgi:Holliday junction resolvasome RuvABC endonuclease subunit
MNILALDLSLTGTGVCLPDGSTTTIKTANLRGPERLRYIRDQVRDYTYLDIKVCIIEGYSYGSAQGACNIGELGGVIRVLLFERDIPIVEIAPKSRAKYATGNGNADKGLVIQHASMRAGRIFDDDNQADAWWLWQMGLAHYDCCNPLHVSVPALHLKALDKIEWPEIGRAAA